MSVCRMNYCYCRPRTSDRACSEPDRRPVASVTSIKVIRNIFALSPTVSKMLTFQICDIEHLGQGHELQHPQ